MSSVDKGRREKGRCPRIIRRVGVKFSLAITVGGFFAEFAESAQNLKMTLLKCDQSASSSSEGKVSTKKKKVMAASVFTFAFIALAF